MSHFGRVGLRPIVGATIAACLVLACSDGPTIAHVVPLDPGSFVISAPTAPTSSDYGTADLLGPDVAYISLPPGSLEHGDLVTLRDLRTGSSATVQLVNGGFDPVALIVAANDTVTASVTTGTDSTGYSFTVPRNTAPVVVRTDPPSNKRDVPLNARIAIVFSEPIAAPTLNNATVVLKSGSTVVTGQLAFSNGSHTMAEFTPSASLAENADYDLLVTDGIQDLLGHSLAANVVVAFTTGQLSAAPATVASVGVSPLTLRVQAGVSTPLTANIRDSAGNTLNDRTVTWTSSAPSVATVSTDGVVSALSQGSATISATCEGKIGTANIVVTPAISGPAVALVFAYQSSNDLVGLTLWGTVSVNAVDASGNAARDFNGQVTLTIGANPGSGSLIGTASVAADGGTGAGTGNATFTGLRIDRAGNGYTLVASAPGLQSATSTAFNVAPINDVIAFTEGSGARGGIGLTDASGRGAALLSRAGDFEPAWSPDGSRIAFSRNLAGQAWDPDMDLFAMSADGSGVIQLTNGQWAHTPAWSPDGSRIAFASARTGGEGITIMNADGTGISRLTTDPTDQNPAWSPDGTRIAFARARNIFIMNRDGTGVRQLTNGLQDFTPAWSPDGTRIAFTRYNATSGNLFLINTDGTGLSQLTSDPVWIDLDPAWSPDGTRIAFDRGTEVSGPDVYVINLDGTGLMQVTQDIRSDPARFIYICGCHSPSWRPRIGGN